MLQVNTALNREELYSSRPQCREPEKLFVKVLNRSPGDRTCLDCGVEIHVHDYFILIQEGISCCECHSKKDGYVPSGSKIVPAPSFEICESCCCLLYGAPLVVQTPIGVVGCSCIVGEQLRH